MGIGVFFAPEFKMRLFLSILLIPLLLVAQSLCAVHAHQGTHSSDAESHAGSPHFHATAGNHHSRGHAHHHSHDGGSIHETSDVSPSQFEHPQRPDGETYYVPDTVSQLGSRIDEQKSLTVSASATTFDLSSLSLDSKRMLTAANQPNRPHGVTARIPLFLRDASIRC